MDTKGLLFIPDISGFTRFVSETEIDHSRRIIQELLEVVIDANQIGLEVSEVEGDAVLFYRFGACPDMRQLYEQVERTFRDFHRRLAAYEISRFCQCHACRSATDLSLKIITHYGEFTTYNVRSFAKLIGKDVIVAHQLLKNDIDQHEYWLVTSDLPGAPPIDLPRPLEWSPGVKRTEGGEVTFHYAPLSELKRDLPPTPLLDLELPERTQVLSATREYDAHIITLLHATGDPVHRSRWQEGVRHVEVTSPHLPRVGMRCCCATEGGEVTLCASSYDFAPDRIEFSETDEGKTSATYFTLESLEPYRTRLTVDLYVGKGLLRRLWFGLTRKRSAEASLARSLDRLGVLVKEIDVPVEY